MQIWVSFQLERQYTKLLLRISLLSLPGKLYAKSLERKCREIVDSKLEDGQCGFCSGRSTRDQLYTQKQIFEKSWEYGKNLFACFVDHEKQYDRVLQDKIWRFCRSMALMVSCCLPLSPSTAKQKCIFVSIVNSQGHSMWALVSGEGAFHLHFF